LKNERGLAVVRAGSGKDRARVRGGWMR